MSKNRIRFLLTVLLMTLLVGCASEDNSKIRKTGTAIYYINENQTGIEAKNYAITETDPQKAVEQMVQELSRTSSEVDYNPAIPSNVDVLSVELTEGLVTLNLSESYYHLNGITQGLCRAAVVDSLVQIEGVGQVAFQVNGEEMTDAEGNAIGALDSESFVQNVGSTLSSYQTASLHLFFANEEGDGLYMETKDVKYNSNVSLEKLIMNQLQKGPSGVGHYRTISPDTTVLSVTIRDGICYVNLDESFLVNEYDIRPEITIYSLVNSLTDGNAITAVQISVNGETNVKYMDTVDLSQPLTEKTEYIMEE